jgi:hypothetical protein
MFDDDLSTSHSSGYSSVSDGGQHVDGTRLIRVQIGSKTQTNVDFTIDARSAIDLGQSLVRAGNQGLGR